MTSLGIEIAYTLVIFICCALIVRKTKCLYDLSQHPGIRFFRQSFRFAGLGILFRFVAVLSTLYPSIYGQYTATLVTAFNILSEYLLSVGGFFLVYSLIWRQMEQISSSKTGAHLRVLALHALAFAIACADVSLDTYHFRFIVQIFVFGYAALLAYDHWKASEAKSVKETFASLYLVVLTTAFLAYLLCYILLFFIAGHPSLVYITYIVTCITFCIILFGVLRVVFSQAYCDRCCPFADHAHLHAKHAKHHAHKRR